MESFGPAWAYDQRKLFGGDSVSCRKKELDLVGGRGEGSLVAGRGNCQERPTGEIEAGSRNKPGIGA